MSRRAARGYRLLTSSNPQGAEAGAIFNGSAGSRDGCHLGSSGANQGVSMLHLLNSTVPNIPAAQT